MLSGRQIHSTAHCLSLCHWRFESNIDSDIACQIWRSREMPKRLIRGLGPVTRRLGVGLVTAGLVLANLTGISTGASASYKAPQPVAMGAPLTFGMSPDEVSAVLGVPLSYVRGSRGNELLLALPNVKG